MRSKTRKRAASAAAVIAAAVLSLSACGSYDVPADKLYSKFAVAANNISHAEGKRVLASDDGLLAGIVGFPEDTLITLPPETSAPEESSVPEESSEPEAPMSGSEESSEPEEISEPDESSVPEDDSHQNADDSSVSDDSYEPEEESSEESSEPSSVTSKAPQTTSSKAPQTTSSKAPQTTSSKSSQTTSSKSSQTTSSKSSQTTSSKSSQDTSSKSSQTTSSKSSQDTSSKASEDSGSTSTVAKDAEKYLTEDVSDLLQLINEERAKNTALKLKPLTLDGKLCEAANVRVMEIQDVWGHTRPNGQSSKDYIRSVMGGKGLAGENIAYNYETAVEVMYFKDMRTDVPPEDLAYGWMETYRVGGKHKDIILNEYYDRIGLAVYEDMSTGRSVKSWVAVFYSTTAHI